jgi:hypothetical protein
VLVLLRQFETVIPLRLVLELVLVNVSVSTAVCKCTTSTSSVREPNSVGSHHPFTPTEISYECNYNEGDGQCST